MQIVADSLSVTGSGSIAVNRTGAGKLILYVLDRLNITGSGKINGGGSGNDVVLYYSGSNAISFGGNTRLEFL